MEAHVSLTKAGHFTVPIFKRDGEAQPNYEPRRKKNEIFTKSFNDYYREEFYSA